MLAENPNIFIPAIGSGNLIAISFPPCMEQVQKQESLCAASEPPLPIEERGEKEESNGRLKNPRVPLCLQLGGGEGARGRSCPTHIARAFAQSKAGRQR